MSRRPFVDDGLKREDFTEDRIAELFKEYHATGVLQILDADTREASRRGLLADHPPGEDLWVFGYGSLMWNPACHTCDLVPALLYGYHRQFCLWTPLGRGTPNNPGLMLALEPGGSCRGMAIRITADLIDSETEILWRREMLSGAYQARWVTLKLPQGRTRAITFVINRDHERYAGWVPLEESVRAIATAAGPLGRCRDYLHNLVLHLDDLGIADGPMHRLHDLVESYES